MPGSFHALQEFLIFGPYPPHEVIRGSNWNRGPGGPRAPAAWQLASHRAGLGLTGPNSVTPHLGLCTPPQQVHKFIPRFPGPRAACKEPLRSHTKAVPNGPLCAIWVCVPQPDLSQCRLPPLESWALMSGSLCWNRYNISSARVSAGTKLPLCI